VIEEISFDAPERAGEKINIDKDYVENTVKGLVKDQELSKFIL
jgi:ATP-dependent HslUV protease ATP-binding subunit HslU